MNSSVQKHLQLILDWVDKGFSTGARKAKLDIDELKKKARELARDLALVAAAFAGTTIALFKFIEMGAKMKDQVETFDRIREKAGLLPGVLNEIREATRGTVTDMDLMKASGKALADGLDPSRIVEFWAKAKQISEANGTPVAQVFDMLYLAVAKGQTRMLTGIGITLDAEEANSKYADSIGKTTAELSLRERQIAVSIALEEKYLKQFKSLGDLGGDNAEKFEQFSTGVVNLKNKFLMMLGESPSIDKFMQMLVDKIGALSSSMDTWEPKIKAVVDGLMHFYEGLVQFASEKAGPAIANIWKYRDAIAALAAVVGTGIVASKIMGIGVALGLVTGGTATGITLLAASFAGLTAAAYPKFHDAMMNVSFMKKDVEATNSVLDELIAKTTAPGLMGLKVPAGGGSSDKWAGAPGINIGEPGGLFTLTTESGILGKKLQLQVDYDQKIRDIRSARSDWEIQVSMIELEMERRGMMEREEIYASGFYAMGAYSHKFFDDSARRSRTLNAMMIVGFGEMIASYIDMKTRQAKLDFLEYSYKAIALAAGGDWAHAAMYAQAAVGAGALGAAGALAAGAVRFWSQQKAEAISSQQEQDWNAAEAAGAGGTGLAGRKQATGIVNTRPIAINVYSTANFNAGYMVFGDSETAANDLYERVVRDKIEADIESGMINVA